MPIGTFPNKIQVTLGTMWSVPEVGNKLKQGDTVVVTKGVGNNWYEDENGSDVANRDTNRIHLRIAQGGKGFDAHWYVCKTGSDNWYPNRFGQFNARYTTSKTILATYNFKDIWAAGSPTPVAFTPFSTYQAAIFIYYAGPSITLGASTTKSGSNAGTVLSLYKNVFSAMEEYVEPSGRAADKTTYRYG